MPWLLCAWATSARASCTEEAPTSGAFRRQLSAILADREQRPPAQVEAELLPLVQDNPCVPAAVLPLAEAQLAQSKRRAALALLESIARIPLQPDNAPLMAAHRLLGRLQRQVLVRLRLADWVPDRACLRVVGADGPVVMEHEGAFQFAFLDPGDYQVSCQAPLIDPSSQSLRVAGDAPISRAITPAPLYLPVAPERFEQPARGQLERAYAAAIRGDWPTARDGLRAALSLREHPRVRFNLAFTYLRLSDPLSAWLTLSELSGLPDWAQPLARRYRDEAAGALVRVTVRAPGNTRMRINGRPVVRTGQVCVLGAPTAAPEPLPPRATLVLAAAPSHELAFEGRAYDVRFTAGPRTRELEEREGLTLELDAGATADLALSPVDAPATVAGGPSLWGPLALMSGAGALGAAALWGFYLPARKLRKEAGCDGSGLCDDLGRLERARDKADVATLASSAAGALALAGVTWGVIELVTAGRAGAEEGVWVRVLPSGIVVRASL